MDQYAIDIGQEPADALCDLLMEENFVVLLVLSKGDDSLIEPFLAHPNHMMGSDGIFHERSPNDQSVVHPRQYGSAARLLGMSVREKQLFSLEEAVHKLSGYPAERFGLHKRGLLREGWFADVVIFDAASIQDHATYLEPHQYSVGVEHVLVNGVSIIRNGEAVADLSKPFPRRALRYK